MNILFLIGAYPTYGGVERVSTVLSNEFMAKGYKVSIISFVQPHPEIADKELNKDVRLYKLTYPTLSKSNIKVLGDIIRENKIDILISQWCMPYYVSILCKRAMKGSSCKLISIYHNIPNTNSKLKSIELDIANNRGNRLLNNIKHSIVKTVSRLSMRITYHNSDRFMVLSPSFIPIAREFIFKKRAPKLVSLTNPITIDVISPNETRDKEIIYVGRIEYNQKRTYRLIDIWSELEDKYPDWRLTIVGDGPDGDDLKDRIDKSNLKRIKIEGYKDPMEYYRRASMLLLVSEYEGFPLVIIEGMSLGVIPVVCGSYASVYDIIDSGVDGCITDYPFTTTSVVDALSQLMDDEDRRVTLSKAAIAKSKMYSLPSIMLEWEKLFKEI